RADGARLAADLAADPKLFADTSTMAYAYRLSLDASAAPALLSGLADVDSPVVPDLLYDLATRAEPGSRLGILASDLLQGRAVRRRASPPLAVALELVDMHDCASVAATLGRIESTADERILSAIERLEKEDGCGPKSKDDCWPCLRDADHQSKLERARDAAKGRPFRPPWALGRP
ncbi:MAG TPA: hypothetical protein VL400_27530, partial [Polyangiaceae bacterium]|nr:hypothetical protein [Polyangiaceae bacterium]